jgi:hypothetical protein
MFSTTLKSRVHVVGEITNEHVHACKMLSQSAATRESGTPCLPRNSGAAAQAAKIHDVSRKQVPHHDHIGATEGAEDRRSGPLQRGGGRVKEDDACLRTRQDVTPLEVDAISATGCAIWLVRFDERVGHDFFADRTFGENGDLTGALAA